VAADDVVDDRPGLADHLVAVDDHRGLTQRMDGGQLRRRQMGLGITDIGLELIGQAQLLQQPEDALRPRLVEVVDDDHAFPLPDALMLQCGIARTCEMLLD
jgi:hypothetical protein